MAVCEFCGDEVTPGAPGVLYAISGWEEARAQGGANMVHLRVRLDKYAHRSCVEDAKPRRAAVRRERRPGIDVTKKFTARVAR